MKFPSIFKTSSPQRFAIKPRYYDPVKEEIEERTSRIKKELEEEGLLSGENSQGYGASIRGSFSSYRGIKPRDTSVFNSTAMIRTLLFFGMISAAFGYIYIGPEIFTYLTYFALIVGGVYFFFRFKKKGKK
ncbi:hypothetical protein [Algoriphagus sp. AK58]|uniref:hypothetical protein n=1 Tax=Algoriphagus sp. AK58 TaxID=1406877 RepID=UPI0016501740|nr:hypothetical protein [Algoriphagus sp. AK58]MBC6366422.1 hypothetical protein [Algoriphagus sp. AK58]